MPQPNIFAGTDTAVCQNSKLTLKANGGINYTWNTQQNTDTISVVITNKSIYYVTASDIYSCSNFDSIVVDALPLPKAYAGEDFSICYNDSTTITASGGIKYSWSNGDTTATIKVFGKNNNTFIVTVTDLNQCSNTDTVIQYTYPQIYVYAGNDKTICKYDSVKLENNSIGIYSWSPTYSLSNYSIQAPYAKPTSTTTYTLKITDGNNCTATDNVIIYVNDLPPADAGNNISICKGTSDTLIATGGIKYKWNTGNSSNTIIVSPDTTTTYTVTVTDTNNCSNTDFVTVVVFNNPEVFIANDTSICLGDKATFTATGAISYQWNPDTTIQNGIYNSASITVKPISTTTYTVTGTDNNNCSASDNIIVYVNPNPVAFAGFDDSICASTQYLLVANGGVNYTWSNGSHEKYNPVKIDTTTTFYLTVSDINGCSASDDVTISTYTLTKPDISISDKTEYCENETINLTLSIPDEYNRYQIRWSSGSTTPAINVTKPGKYSLFISDNDNKCIVYSDTITITSTPLPKANFSFNDSLLKITFINKSLYYDTLLWDFGDGNTSTDISPIYNYNQNGNFTVTLIATNICGTDTTYQTINVKSVGINNITQNNNITIFPNPVSDYLFINSYDINKPELITIYNYLGQIVYQQHNTYQQTIKINLSNLPAGIYNITITTNSTQQTKQIIKQ